MFVSSVASCNYAFCFFLTVLCKGVIMILITQRSPGDVRHTQATELGPSFKYVSATLRLEL